MSIHLNPRFLQFLQSGFHFLTETTNFRIIVLLFLLLSVPWMMWMEYSTKKQISKNTCPTAFASATIGNWSKIPLFSWFQAYQPCLITVIHYMIGISMLYRFYRFIKSCCIHRKHTKPNENNNQSPFSSPSPFPSFSTSTLLSNPSTDFVNSENGNFPLVVSPPKNMSAGNYHIRLSACSQRKVSTLNKAPTVYFLSFDTDSSLLQLMDSPRRWYYNRYSELNSDNTTLRIDSQTGLGYMVACALATSYTGYTGNTESKTNGDSSTTETSHSSTCGSALILQTNGRISWGDDRILCWVKTSNPDTPDEIAWKIPSTSTDYIPLYFSFTPLSF